MNNKKNKSKLKQKLRNSDYIVSYKDGGLTDAIGIAGMATGTVGQLTNDPVLSGVASGASSGLAFGPIGAGVGALIGGIGGIFSAAHKRKLERIARANELNNMMQSNNQIVDQGLRNFASGGKATKEKLAGYSTQDGKELFKWNDGTVTGEDRNISSYKPVSEGSNQYYGISDSYVRPEDRKYMTTQEQNTTKSATTTTNISNPSITTKINSATTQTAKGTPSSNRSVTTKAKKATTTTPINNNSYGLYEDEDGPNTVQFKSYPDYPSDAAFAKANEKKNALSNTYSAALKRSGGDVTEGIHALMKAHKITYAEAQQIAIENNKPKVDKSKNPYLTENISNENYLDVNAPSFPKYPAPKVDAKKEEDNINNVYNSYIKMFDGDRKLAKESLTIDGKIDPKINSVIEKSDKIESEYQRLLKKFDGDIKAVNAVLKENYGVSGNYKSLGGGNNYTPSKNEEINSYYQKVLKDTNYDIGTTTNIIKNHFGLTYKDARDVALANKYSEGEMNKNLDSSKGQSNTNLLDVNNLPISQKQEKEILNKYYSKIREFDGDRAAARKSFEDNNTISSNVKNVLDRNDVNNAKYQAIPKNDKNRYAKEIGLLANDMNEDELVQHRNLSKLQPSVNAAKSSNTETSSSKIPFYDGMENVRKSTEESLKKAYRTENVQVKITQKGRTKEQQAEMVRRGASNTHLSLHNFDAGADFEISINGVKQTGRDAKSLEPYRHLGKAAKDAGYFWGWADDSGHVGETEYTHEYLRKHPEAAQSEQVKQFYKEHKNSSEIKYQPLLETLDDIYQTPTKRTYTGIKKAHKPYLTPYEGESPAKKSYTGRQQIPMQYPFGGETSSMPIQAEEYQGQKEMIQYPNGQLDSTNATQSHEQMMPGQATDAVPNNSKIFSARNKYTKSQWKAINDVTGGVLDMNMLPKTKGKISPADIAESVMKKYQKTPTANAFATAELQERNKQLAVEKAFMFNEVVNPQKEQQQQQMPQFASGGKNNSLYELQPSLLNPNASFDLIKNRYNAPTINMPNVPALPDYAQQPGTLMPTPQYSGKTISTLGVPGIDRRTDDEKWDDEHKYLDMYGNPMNGAPTTPTVESFKDAIPELRGKKEVTKPTEEDSLYKDLKRQSRLDKALLYGTAGVGLLQGLGAMNQEMYPLESHNISPMLNMNTDIPIGSAKNDIYGAQRAATNSLFSNTNNYQAAAANATNVAANSQGLINQLMGNVATQRNALQNQKLSMWQQLLGGQEAAKGAFNQDKTTLKNYKKTIPGDYAETSMENVRNYILKNKELLFAAKTSKSVYDAMLKLFAGDVGVTKLLQGMKDTLTEDPNNTGR